MKASLHAFLIATAVLAGVSCSPGPEDSTEPVADASGSQGQPSEGGNDAGEGNADARPLPNNPLANRLRLPDMTGLPTDKELASNKPKEKGGDGVIVRPPSE